MQILLIRQSPPGFFLGDLHFRSGLFFVPGGVCPLFNASPLVRKDVVQVQHDRHEGRGRLRREHGGFGRVVVWRVSGLESLRADDVADRERARNGGAGERPFGLAGAVGGGPVVDDGEWSNDGVNEVDAN